MGEKCTAENPAHFRLEQQLQLLTQTASEISIQDIAEKNVKFAFDRDRIDFMCNHIKGWFSSVKLYDNSSILKIVNYSLRILCKREAFLKR